MHIRYYYAMHASCHANFPVPVSDAMAETTLRWNVINHTTDVGHVERGIIAHCTSTRISCVNCDMGEHTSWLGVHQENPEKTY